MQRSKIREWIKHNQLIAAKEGEKIVMVSSWGGGEVLGKRVVEKEDIVRNWIKFEYIYHNVCNVMWSCNTNYYFYNISHYIY